MMTVKSIAAPVRKVWSATGLAKTRGSLGFVTVRVKLCETEALVAVLVAVTTTGTEVAPPGGLPLNVWVAASKVSQVAPVNVAAYVVGPLLLNASAGTV